MHHQPRTKTPPGDVAALQGRLGRRHARGPQNCQDHLQDRGAADATHAVPPEIALDALGEGVGEVQVGVARRQHAKQAASQLQAVKRLHRSVTLEYADHP